MWGWWLMPSFKNINFTADQGGPVNQPRLSSLSRLSNISVLGSDAKFRFPFPAPSAGMERLAKASDETAGRLLLQTYLEDAGSETLREVTAPNRPELIPDMIAGASTPVPALSANRVVFQQTSHAIPIFGARVAVDVDSSDKSLVAINGKVTPVPDVNPKAKLSPDDALESLISWSGADRTAAANARNVPRSPVLTWFLKQETERWHLTYHFIAVPIQPQPEKPLAHDPFPTLAHVCLGHAPRSEVGLYDYFVDAHDGAVVYYFSSTPHIDIPAPMRGIDVAGNPQDFYGLSGAGYFALTDPLRNIETYDFSNNDLNASPPPTFPTAPIKAATNNLGNTFPAAVSAHYHARVVYDFFNDVLKRDGIDDRGMKLISVVNVYSSNQNSLPRPQWGNAVWWQNKMWYGQQNGVSFAKYLDVIAHELTHGVTATSSNLVYRDIPGALNESYSDIFGVIIANWYPAAPQPIASWNWEIGSGLGSGGGPIRDFSNPARTGQPDHWSKYQPLPANYDSGGVHVYSGIHNKAVHALLTGLDANGKPTFPVAEAVLLLYLTLTRLTPTSDFRDSRRTLESVVRAYHISDQTTMAVRLAAIASAFQTVGL
jgi:bacillolysin/neutral peptidase B